MTLGAAPGQARDQLVGYLRHQMCGPTQGDAELLQERPDRRYLLGILYPRGTELSLSQADSSDESGRQDPGEMDPIEEPEALTSMFAQRAPAAMGISFMLKGTTEFGCSISAAVYDERSPLEGRRSPQWQRRALAPPEAHEEVQFSLPVHRHGESLSVLEGRAELHVVSRPMSAGFLVTVTLLNAKRCPDNEAPQPSDCLFQAGLQVAPIGGSFGAYPRVDRRTSDEEAELELQYRERITWAIGHACAAVWDPEGDPPTAIRCEFLPSYELRPITTQLPAENLSPDAVNMLSLQHLWHMSELDPEALKQGLSSFLDSYAGWIDEQFRFGLEPKYRDARERVVAKQRRALTRMRDGVELLHRDADARKAFGLAQRAMLMQMVHSSQEQYGRQLKERDSRPYQAPDYHDAKWATRTWRPFQLAYQLMVLPSLYNPSHTDRDLVDLLWFPTGGGKTEAYLALTAFEAVRRRLQSGADGGGTGILMRYTMRLLTSQQFERAAALMLALERLRLSYPELGEEQFSIGLWVGAAATPNRYTQSQQNNRGAWEHYNDVLGSEEPDHPFQLQRCPWCGTRIAPKRGTGHAPDYGFRATSSSFAFNCPSADCPFHDGLPIQVIDEALFEQPPTLLLATIDKFARLAWDPSGGAFLGCHGRHRPPSLIIQDELHLISGPLGSVAGLYEAAIEVAMRAQGSAPPKLLAATATIRNAASQIQGLYGRDMAMFPPAGISVDDSFFARIDPTAPGRLYVGLMGQGVSPVSTTIQTIASLAQGVLELKFDERERDAYWTQIVYHNSKRELGATLTRARDNVPQHLSFMSHKGARKLHHVQELSAYVKGPQIPVIMQRLETAHPDPDAIDLLACTNMLSVGVDVQRLGLMLMIGQPKQTAEYIQATSRVGRDANRPPGLVVVHYSGTKPRDRSYFENFQSYHQALYREVEPTSVTPCAPRARDRALHAALVTLMRIAGGLAADDAAAQFDPANPRVEALLLELLERLEKADSGESESIAEQLAELSAHWASRANTRIPPLRYKAKGGKQFAALLCQYGARQEAEAWPTLNSMRHVDLEAPLRVKGA